MRVYSCVAIAVFSSFPASSVGGMFGPSNYQECILDEMPGVKSDSIAIQVIRTCWKEFSGSRIVERKKPLFGINTEGECLLKYGKDVASPKGLRAIREACRRFYPRYVVD